MVEFAVAAKAYLEVVERDMNRLFQTSLAMVRALWPNKVVPDTVSGLAR